MHELSVAIEICRLVQERLEPSASSQVRRVGIIVGDDAGLEPDNLSFCLDALLSQPPFGSAHAVMTRCAGNDLRVDYFEVDDGNPDD